MNGECLCGNVKFRINGKLPDLYQCHCSQCRKSTGAAANASCIVTNDMLEWLQGQEGISSYTDPSGYRLDFCSNCGSPLPNKMKDPNLYWVPAGLLDNNDSIRVRVHVCVASKACWDEISGSEKQYDEVPELAELVDSLQKHN